MADLDLAQYNTNHRQSRQRTEEGSVKIISGANEKKWQGSYHVYVTKPDGTKTRSHRTRIIGQPSI